MQLPPTLALAHLIKHFLLIESESATKRNLRMFPDGNTGMVFNYKDPVLIQQGNQPAVLLPPCFLYGPFSRFQDIISTGKIGLLVAVFHPFVVSSLLKTEAKNLIDQVINLHEVYNQEASDLSEQIAQAMNSFMRIKVLEDFFLKKLPELKSINTNAQQAVRLIQQQNGDVPVGKLLSSLHVSERKLQRIFEDHIGYSPKRFAGITRVQFFLKLLRKNQSESYTRLVYETGFFDQAHLIRSMKNISGITPSEYLGQSDLLAANFLEIRR